MSQVLLQENAERNLLQAGEGDINIVVTFDRDVLNVYTCESAEPDKLSELYQSVCDEEIGGGTNIYAAAQYAIEMLQDKYDVSDYTTAVILMTDGASVTATKPDFEDFYRSSGTDIPVFSIMFGSAEREQLDDISQH